MSDEKPTAVEVLDRDEAPLPEQLQQIGIVPSANYRAAIEIGHVAAASQLYPEARTAARAAMVVMIGMDLGLTPATALMGIHISESKGGRINFLVESKVLAALIQRRPDLDYRIAERGDEKVTVEFWRDGEQQGAITWDQARAVRAQLWGKPGPWQQYPTEMLTWRALAEGTRLYFPEVLQGQRLYVEGELDDLDYRKALDGPAATPVLTDERAEAIRAEAFEVWKEIEAAKPGFIPEGKLVTSLRQAAHSHTELELTLRRLQERLGEAHEFQDALEAISEGFGDEAAKEAGKVADRRGSLREGIEQLEKTLERLTAEAEPIEETDA